MTENNEYRIDLIADAPESKPDNKDLPLCPTCKEKMVWMESNCEYSGGLDRMVTNGSIYYCPKCLRKYKVVKR